MKLINCCCIWCTVFGVSNCISPSAFRNLNRKVNLLKTTFQNELDSQRATFQRQINDLKYEVLDLRTELQIERVKTARLQELLNGTDTDEATVFTGASERQERIGSIKTAQPLESGILQHHTQQLNQLNESIEVHQSEIADNKEAIKRAKELLQEMLVCTTLRKAFQEEKIHNQQMMKHMTAERARAREMGHVMSVGMAEMRNETKVLTKQVENNTVNIATLRNDLADQDQSINYTLDETFREVRKQSKLSSEISGSVQTMQQKLTMANATIAEIIENITALQINVETVVEDTIDNLKKMNLADLISTQTRCLEAIRAGGEAMGKLLYVGVTVKGRKGSGWGDQDGRAEGRVVHLLENKGNGMLLVRWDDGSGSLHRLGKLIDILIVEEKFDFSRCK